MKLIFPRKDLDLSNFKNRNNNLSDLKPFDEKCVWCGINKLTGKQRKYCNPDCGQSALIYLNPQTNWGLLFILPRQNFKCTLCQYDWKLAFSSHIEIVLKKLKKDLEFWQNYNSHQKFELTKAIKTLEKSELSYGFIEQFKKIIPKNKRIEIDHRHPVAMGGLTIGFSNIHAVCHECHKNKTKIDIQRIKDSKD